MAELPPDLLMEILSRLPAKEVSKLRSVNKTLLDSTSDRFFFVTQSRRTKSDSAIFVQGRDSSFELFFLDACSGMPHESLDFIRESGRILGSSNGLVLYQCKEGELYELCLYNPVRHTCLPLVCPDGIDLCSIVRLGIGVTFSESSPGDVHYQIVCILPGEEWGDDMVCKLYSSRERKWRETNMGILEGARNMVLEHPVVSNGIIYMVSDCDPYIAEDNFCYKPYIVAFDIEKECSTILPVPEDVGVGLEHRIAIAAWGEESICSIHCEDSFRFTIWMLKDHRDGSWVKIQEVTTESMGLETVLVGSFTLINSITLVFTVEETAYAYNLVDKELKELGLHGHGLYPSLRGYANTLRPCGEFEWKIIKL